MTTIKTKTKALAPADAYKKALSEYMRAYKHIQEGLTHRRRMSNGQMYDPFTDKFREQVKDIQANYERAHKRLVKHLEKAVEKELASAGKQFKLDLDIDLMPKSPQLRYNKSLIRMLD